jgi:hypothetical protein
LLCIEAVILGVVTFFCFIMSLNVLSAALTGSLGPADLPLALMFFCMLGLLMVGWYMLSRRLFYGPLALRKVSRLWWLAATFGVLLGIIGFVFMFTNAKVAMFSMAMWGVPTFVHLALETWVWPPASNERPAV